jgi:hypothetical protein
MMPPTSNFFYTSKVDLRGNLSVGLLYPYSQLAIVVLAPAQESPVFEEDEAVVPPTGNFCGGTWEGYLLWLADVGSEG